MNFEIMFACGYTDGTNEAIRQILNNKLEKIKKFSTKDIYSYAYLKAYLYYINLRSIFKNNQEFLLYINNCQEKIEEAKVKTLEKYNKSEKIKKVR